MTKMLSANSPGLHDSFGRHINYLRLAVTDRCNLNCVYCRPPITSPAQKAGILTYPELLRIVRLFSGLGITKVRLTGGEPFSRAGLMDFIGKVTKIPGIEKVSITTNGTLCFNHIKTLKQTGISGLNFSLDTLSPSRFQRITGVNLFHDTFSTIMEAVLQGIRVKVNVVVLDEHNTDELLHLAGLAKNLPLEVRFIEPMYFNGVGKFLASSWNASALIKFFMKNIEGCVETIAAEPSTARVFKAKDYQGTIGVIGGHSRTFCHACNKIRITSHGMMKNCLYDQGALDLKNMLRDNFSDEEIKRTIGRIVSTKAADGLIASQMNPATGNRSMALIGG